MYFKCELVVDGYAHDVSEDLRNWDDISISYKRNDYDGVVRSFSTKFEFINRAYSFLKREYRSKYLNSSATVIVYKRNNSWLWSELFRCSLDFSTLSDDGYVISINAIDNSLASIIKAKKGVQYEYLVDEIKEKNQLYYDRLDMLNTVNWVVVGDSVENSSDVTLSFDGVGYEAIPLYMTSSEVYTNNSFEVSDVDPGNVSVYSGFLKAKKSVTFDLSINIDFLAYVSASDNTRIILFKNGVVFNDLRWNNDGTNHTKINVDITLSLNKDDVLSLGIYSKKEKYTVLFAEKSISVKWKERNDNFVNIDIVRPINLLNRLLDSMSGNEGEIAGSIETGVDDRLDTALLVPAESIRGLNGAKIYTSYTKFAEWMNSMFGFVPVIGEKTLSFVHRDSLYKKEVVKTIEKQINDFEYSVNSSLIYSRVKVGYDKQDYDSINGRDEFRFTNEFVTGNTLTDNSLDLISPYRADAYGIEFLAQKRGQDTTDNDSDKDTFFVSAKLNSDGSKYELIRSGNGGPSISGVISPSTMFNVMYSPKSMLEANKRFIGTSVDSLVFASSDGNSDVTIDGIKETSDLIIENRLFTVGELSFGTSDLDIPSDWAGRISVAYMDEVYECHVSSTKINGLKDEEVKYSLIVDEIK
jgi:hypothetical protein